MRIEQASRNHLSKWAEMRYALWMWDTVEDHAGEAEALYLTGHPDRAAFVAFDDAGQIIAFAEAAVRRDYVEGCETSPVTFLEGIYVKPEARKRGAARRLAEMVGAWGRECGCAEYASNALLDNADSHAFHAAIGFVETERVVFFKQNL